MGWALWPMGNCLWSKILRQGYGKCCELCCPLWPDNHLPIWKLCQSLLYNHLSFSWLAITLSLNQAHLAPTHSKPKCPADLSGLHIFRCHDDSPMDDFSPDHIARVPASKVIVQFAAKYFRLFSREKACEMTHWWWVIDLCFSNEWIWSIKWLKNGGLSLFLLSTWTGGRQWPMSPENSTLLQVGKFRNAG